MGIRPGEIFLTKLRTLAELGPDDENAVRSMSFEVRMVGPRVEIFSHGNRCDAFYVLLAGMAAESKTLSTGKRQILSLYVPGDILNINGVMTGRFDNDVTTLDPCTLGFVDRRKFLELLFDNPGVAKALCLDVAAESAILRNRIVSLGRRTSEKRLAHLLLETRVRLLTAKGGQEGMIELPLTQQELADVLGFSMVHVNRTLQKLRGAGLIEVRPKIRIAKLRALEELAEFDGRYLSIRETSTVDRTASTRH